MHRNTSSKTSGCANYGRNKGRGLAAAFLVLVFGWCAAVPTVQAEDMRKTGLSSRGSLIYLNDEKEDAQIYATDFLLLKESLDTIPDTVFDPARYTYTTFFEAVDETCHRTVGCPDDMEICPEYEPVTEEHYAFYYLPCEDGSHHEKICMDCGYRETEACRFDLSCEDGGLRCCCGNRKTSDMCDENRDFSSDTEDREQPADANSETANSDADANKETENPNDDTNENAEAENSGDRVDEKAETENPDGSMNGKAETENPDDSADGKAETENPNGNAEEKTETKNPDGGVAGKETPENQDGSAGTETELIDAKPEKEKTGRQI